MKGAGRGGGRAVKGEAGEGFYLFCFARADLLPPIEGRGVDGRSPLLLWRYLDIASVLSRVVVGEFCGVTAEADMQELSWLGPRACRHEEVVEQVMHHSPVLPARFGTIFSSLRVLERLLRKHHGAISAFLDSVVDKEEWAVKGFLHRSKAQEYLFARALASQEGSLHPSPGRRYFQERRLQARAEEELHCWLRGSCSEFAGQLSRYASDFRERRVLSSGSAGRTVVLNWAFLVPRGALADFRGQIDRANAEYAERGLAFECSGPWPPYSFSPPLQMGVCG